jgi:hypothetical protein
LFGRRGLAESRRRAVVARRYDLLVVLWFAGGWLAAEGWVARQRVGQAVVLVLAVNVHDRDVEVLQLEPRVADAWDRRCEQTRHDVQRDLGVEAPQNVPRRLKQFREALLQQARAGELLVRHRVVALGRRPRVRDQGDELDVATAVAEVEGEAGDADVARVGHVVQVLERVVADEDERCAAGETHLLCRLEVGAVLVVELAPSRRAVPRLKSADLRRIAETRHRVAEPLKDAQRVLHVCLGLRRREDAKRLEFVLLCARTSSSCWPMWSVSAVRVAPSVRA